MPIQNDAPVAALEAPAATPFARLVGVIFSSNAGTFVALFTATQLLLTLHTTRIAGEAAAAFGIITGFGALFALIANPLAGRISDRTAARLGRRRTWILVGGLSGALVYFGLAFTTEIWQVAVIWCVAQVMYNFQFAATSALLADQVPHTRRGTVSGFMGLSGALAPLVGIALVSIVTDPAVQWGVIAVTSAALSTLAVLMLRDPKHVPAAGEGGLNLKELLRSFWLNPWKHPAFGWAFLVRFLVTCAYASGTYGAFFMMDRFGFTPEDVAGPVLLTSLLAVALLALGSVVGGFVSDKLQRQKPFVVAGGAIGAAGLTLQAFAPSIEYVYVAAALLGIGTGLFFAIDSALCVRMLPSAENAGKDFAIINIANTVPQSFVPFIAPALLALGGYNALYLTLAAFGLAGAVAVARLPELGREGDPRFAAITRGE
ncbi:MFS transporter [Sphaerisporangium sp. NPDC051017]|uniref:MFS transporter n=1 Tax=Sphaerisporangium sp. NPDC051017 TaxID=3154636 RepID=UPI003422A17C